MPVFVIFHSIKAHLLSRIQSIVRKEQFQPYWWLQLRMEPTQVIYLFLISCMVYVHSLPSMILFAYKVTVPAPALGAVESPSPAFSWPAFPALTYATPRSKPSSNPTFARAYGALSSLVENQTMTTWASISSPTDSVVKYGNVAWSSL